jgi:hypothetical protein
MGKAAGAWRQPPIKLMSFSSSMTPAGNNLDEYYQKL